MDVKSAFLNGELDEEVYGEQPPGFENQELLDFVYFLFKAIYGLKQAPKKWYETLSGFLIENGFVRGIIEKTHFLRNIKMMSFLSKSMWMTLYLGLLMMISARDLLS